MIRCLIVDDEPLSHDVLKKYLRDIPGMELAGSCFNAMDAMDFIRQYPVDLVFLDINMPILSGIGFIRSLEKPPWVIFTTAYPEYAVEGFELNAVDYLLKPVSFERFLKAVNKAKDHFMRAVENDGKPINDDQDFITLKTDKKIYRVNFRDLVYLEAYGDYVKVHLTDRTLIVTDTLKNFELNLPPNFFRIHKSYMVDIRKISYLEGNMVTVGSVSLPLGTSYREVFLERFNKRAAHE